MSNLFRDYLEKVEKAGNLVTIEEDVSKVYEIGQYLEDHDNKNVVEFTSIENSEFGLLGNVCASRDMLAMSMEITRNKLHDHLLEALTSPSEPELVDNAPFMDNVSEEVDFDKHPIPKYYKEDAGHYFTSGLIITKGLDTGVHNSSIHRQLVLSKNETAARIVPRHLFHNIKVAEERDEDLPIAIAFGLHPAVILAASTPTSIAIDEMHVANRLLPDGLQRVELPHSGIKVPAHAEVVYEGVVLKNTTAEEGPFVDVTGTLDKVRQEPKIRIDRIYYRDGGRLTTILPSQTEHYILMGLGREAKIRESVLNVVPKVGQVYLSNGGGGWLRAIVAVQKQSEGDAKNAIMAAFAAHGSLKWVTVVDLDINVYDPVEVEWATVTRTGEDDIFVMNKARGSSLDPAQNEDLKVSIKVGIDATKSLYKNPESYRKIRIPRDEE